MNSSVSSNFTEIVSELKQLKKAVVLCHVFPDADAIGSAGAMTLGLIASGVDAKLHLADKIPERLKKLAEEVPLIDEISEGDTLVVLDTANKARVAFREEGFFKNTKLSLGSIFNIDHHISNPLWADFNLVKGDYPAAAAIVLEILEAMEIEFSREISNLLYAGLLEDTGSFRFSNSTSVAFTSAGRMVELGAEPELVANQIYFNVPQRVVRLRGLAIPQITTELNGRVGLLIVTDQLLNQAGAEGGDTEGLVDEVRAISGVEGAVMIRERDGSWKVSLRSKSDELDVNVIAKEFGGGGHKAAAGCTLSGEIKEVKKRILLAFEKNLS